MTLWPTGSAADEKSTVELPSSPSPPPGVPLGEGSGQLAAREGLEAEAPVPNPNPNPKPNSLRGEAAAASSGKGRGCGSCGNEDESLGGTTSRLLGERETGVELADPPPPPPPPPTAAGAAAAAEGAGESKTRPRTSMSSRWRSLRWRVRRGWAWGCESRRYQRKLSPLRARRGEAGDPAAEEEEDLGEGEEEDGELPLFHGQGMSPPPVEDAHVTKGRQPYT